MLLKLKGFDTYAGDRVRFHVTDVFLLSSGSSLPALPEGTELEGTILDFSDSGQKARYFAVVEVVITQSLIVPVQKLEVVETSPRNSDS